jgi:hypothetical protein
VRRETSGKTMMLSVYSVEPDLYSAILERLFDDCRGLRHQLRTLGYALIDVYYPTVADVAPHYPALRRKAAGLSRQWTRLSASDLDRYRELLDAGLGFEAGYEIYLD